MPITQQSIRDDAERFKAQIRSGIKPAGRQRSALQTPPAKRVGDELQSLLVHRHKATCTRCFTQALRELNAMSASEARSKRDTYVPMLWENFATAARENRAWAKAVIERHPKMSDPFYGELFDEACDACDRTILDYEMPRQDNCTDADIVMSSNSHGFGDAMILSWVAEGAKLQGIKIAHYATGKMAELLGLFGQEITDDPTKARRIEPVYKKLSQLSGKESYMRLYCDWLGVKEVVRPPLVELPATVEDWASEQTQKPTVILFPQCTRTIRTWPQNYWLVLQQMLRDSGCSTKLVVWSGAHNWTRYSSDVLSDISWAHTAALMRRSKLVIGNNSGCVHVAGTLDVPTMVLSGLTTAESLGGIPSMRHVSVTADECRCVGCCHATPPKTKSCELGCMALQSLTPTMVMREVHSMFKSPV